MVTIDQSQAWKSRKIELEIPYLWVTDVSPIRDEKIPVACSTFAVLPCPVQRNIMDIIVKFVNCMLKLNFWGKKELKSNLQVPRN